MFSQSQITIPVLNNLIAGLLPYVPKRLVWIVSRRYIAGDTLQDAIQAASVLNTSGVLTTIDLLGEHITSLDEAFDYTRQYVQIIETCEQQKVKVNYSLKPTMFGLKINKEVCYRNIQSIVFKAAHHNSFIRIDMEDATCVDDTLELYRRLNNEFPGHVGVVLQAYMRRTFSDIRILEASSGAVSTLNFRLCKGIYREPFRIAYKNNKKVNMHYMLDLEYMLKKGIYVGIATHDRELVEGALRLIRQFGVRKDKYEFQMLHGVTPGLRQEIVDAGHVMRVYIPFGHQWQAYSLRRLRENPTLVTHILRALLLGR